VDISIPDDTVQDLIDYLQKRPEVKIWIGLIGALNAHNQALELAQKEKLGESSQEGLEPPVDWGRAENST